MNPEHHRHPAPDLHPLHSSDHDSTPKNILFTMFTLLGGPIFFFAVHSLLQDHPSYFWIAVGGYFIVAGGLVFRSLFLRPASSTLPWKNAWQNCENFCRHRAWLWFFDNHPIALSVEKDNGPGTPIRRNAYKLAISQRFASMLLGDVQCANTGLSVGKFEIKPASIDPNLLEIELRIGKAETFELILEQAS